MMNTRPLYMAGRRAFTLIEVSIAGSIGLLVAFAAYSVIMDTVRVAASAELQQRYTAQARLIYNRMAADSLGCQLYQVCDNFTNRGTVGTGGGTVIVFAHMRTMNTTTPVLSRLVCYYLDTTNSEALGYYTLRRLDSSEASGATWPAMGSALPLGVGAATFLPPAADMRKGAAIAQIDFASGQAAQLPRYQLFYPQNGTLSVNLMLRYGNDTKSYIAPIQLNLNIRK